MVNYWAIAIGINQYQLFQPLSCAQADAEALKDFLVTETGFLPENSLLMTTTSPPIGERASYPTKENILFLLEELAATSWQPEDQLWFFFSGYGVNHNDKDYLMPVEGNAELVRDTGIEVRSLMQGLQVTGLNVLLILDINRAFGTQADAPVGQEILELAQELQLATILSCQPEEFSHESSELGLGFFTAALLQALRSGKGSSLADLNSYLSSFTPELCQHHWRPIQNPATFIPSKPQVILPILTLDSDSEAEQIIFPEENFAVRSAALPLGNQDSKNSTSDKAWWAESKTVETTTLNKTSSEVEKPATSPDGTVSNPLVDSHQMLATSPELNTAGRFIPSAAKDYASPSVQANSPIWKQFILWGGGSMIIVGLMATFLLRNQASFRFKQLSTAVSNPTVSQTIEPTQPVSAPIASTPDPKQREQAVFELAKMSLSETKAADLSQAIATARKIQPGEPLYQQAQDNIQVWSQMILDLATERAQKGQYGEAIATSKLITTSEALYPQAQAAIEKWRLEAKQYVSNKTVLDAANALIQPGQASSYNRAIEVAKRVPPGQPGFDIAQQSINQWSEQILDLAKNRAAQGDFSTAIETATLVPEVTAAYEDAQDALQKWQAQKN
ncbi:caspase family protein [Anabaena catenula]|uniref:Caspase family protein n=1 Tax=Anabaena catenula FACHB-362 TaxID=2692877 RepID=A0ABR8J2V8_9NOST|nr:caspase family protein [Anabaena catenula]MBD2691486.1 caspase family protein [Anabaena catenula FACHB-362]